MMAITLALMIALTAAAPALAATKTDKIRVTLLNQDPDPAEPGEYVELRFKVTKTGDERYDNITFNLPEEFPIVFDGTDEQEKRLGGWSGYTGEDEYYILHYKVLVDEDAREETYDIPLEMRADGMTVKREYDLRVREETSPTFMIGDLTSSPHKLYGDSDENKLVVEVQNTGDEGSENVVASLNLPEGFMETYGYSTRATLGSIPAGGSKVAEFYVDTARGLEAGEHDTALSLTYQEVGDEDNTELTTQVPLSLPVHGRPLFEVTDIRYSGDELSPESEASVYVTVLNNGSEEAESVSLRAYVEASQPFEFTEKSDFIGRLKPGQSGEAALSFSVDAGAKPKEYLMDLEVRGVHNDEVVTDDGVLSATVADGRQRAGLLSVSMPLVLAVILVVIAAYLAYRTGRFEGRKR